MSSDRQISRDCIAVAFYGISANSKLLAQFYRDLIDWFKSVACPPDKIAWAYQLSDNPSRALRIHAADNPSMQPPVLWDAAEHLPHRGCGLTAASHPDCPPKVLDRIVQYGLPDAKAAAARHPHASQEQLARLAAMKDAKIVTAALDNPNTSPAVIVRIALTDPRRAVSERARKVIARRGFDPVSWGDPDGLLSIEA